ncbi:MAG TPA: ribonuclease III [Gammaproteobacteria bacterium]|nr:ribonuclease III [Gammaproteobacteria bacterium]
MISRADWAEKHLHYTFKDPALLERALTHRSASRDNNERLEYLGDSFLSFATARRLYDLRPHDDEGDLSRARASLVKQSTLATIGQRLQLDAQVILGPGELRSGGAQRVAMLADAVEALIGAVLLDGGAVAAESLIDLLFAPEFANLPDAATLKDPKTRLQEWLQGNGFRLPVYSVQSVSGRDHEQTFIVTCTVEEKDAHTTGRGPSRRHAEQEAAAAMLSVLTGEP